jgi:valyl-tRNA synthetase
MNVPPSKKAHVYVVSDNKEIQEIFENGKVFFASLSSASQVTVQSDKTGIQDDAVSAVIHQAVIYLPLAELVDIAKEIERLEKEETRLQGEIARSNGMLHNEKFISRAPEAKVAEERAKKEKYESMLAQVQERLSQLR